MNLGKALPKPTTIFQSSYPGHIVAIDSRDTSISFHQIPLVTKATNSFFLQIKDNTVYKYEWPSKKIHLQFF